MAKYKVKSLSVHLGNRVVRKNETPKIDGDKFPATQIVAAEKAGFIEKEKEKSEKKQNSGEQKSGSQNSGQNSGEKGIGKNTNSNNNK